MFCNPPAFAKPVDIAPGIKVVRVTPVPLFAHPVEPAAVAKAGYEGMLKGTLNVVSGLTFVQKIFMSMAPLLPKKMMLKQVYDMQTIKK